LSLLTTVQVQANGSGYEQKALVVQTIRAPLPLL